MHVIIILLSWDTRSNDSKASLTRKAHKGEVYSLDFNQKNQHLLLSGGEDGDVCFWDIRNFSKKVSLKLNSFTLLLGTMIQSMS